MKISALKLGISGGIIWGLSMFVFTVISIYTGYATAFLKIMSSIYPGYKISWAGSFLGLIYGFVDAFIGLFLLACIYNLMNLKIRRSK